MMQVGPCGQPLQSASCMQRVAQVPFTHWSRTYEQSVSSVHWETRRQSGWQMPWSQKSAGFAHVLVQFAWQVALMQVLFAGQSVLKVHCCGGFWFFMQMPFWQLSPVPQFSAEPSTELRCSGSRTYPIESSSTHWQLR